MSTTTTNSLPNPINPPSPSTPSLTSTTPSTFSPTLPHSPETTRQIAEARTFLEASITNIGSSLDNSLKSRAQNLHANSTQLEKQQKQVIKATEGLRKENEKLGKVLKEGGKKVKELGNVQNWAEMLERDFMVLQETVRLANGGSESGSQTGSGSWESGSEGSLGDEEMGDGGDEGFGGVGQSDGMNGVRIGESSGVERGLQDADVREAAGSSREIIAGTNDVKIGELPALDQSVHDGINPEDRMDIEGDANVFEQPAVVAQVEAVLPQDVNGLEHPGIIDQSIIDIETKPVYQVDGEGDIQMDDPVPESKGKGKEVEITSVPTVNLPISQGDILESLSLSQVEKDAIYEDVEKGNEMEVLSDPTAILASPEAEIQASSLSSVEKDPILADKGKGKETEVISDFPISQEATEENILHGEIGEGAMVEKTGNGEKRVAPFDSALQATPQEEVLVSLSSDIVPEEKKTAGEVEILSGSAAPPKTSQEEIFDKSSLGVEDATNDIKGKERINDQTPSATIQPTQLLESS